MRFSQSGYEHVGARDIAKDAGVDAALVNRYFGSKEQLFAEAISGIFHTEDFDLYAENVGERIAQFILLEEDEGDGGSASVADVAFRREFDPLRLLLQSSVSPTASALVAKQFHEDFVEPLAKKLGGRKAKARAALIASYTIGLSVMRLALKSPALRKADSALLIRLFSEAVRMAVESSADR
ncbi:Transcriptional regulator, TetR family protein [Minicystis rosea]|nr:Transcriptional regulator, TetR family protein [Minicystis rosea]